LADPECADRADQVLAHQVLVDRECAALAHREWHLAVSDAALVARLGDVTAITADRKVADAPKDDRMVVVPMVVPVAATVVVPKVVGPMVARREMVTVPVMVVATVDLIVRATAVATAAAAKKTKRSNERVVDPTTAGS
jgi:hypothetical protein